MRKYTSLMWSCVLAHESLFLELNFIHLKGATELKLFSADSRQQDDSPESICSLL